MRSAAALSEITIDLIERLACRHPFLGSMLDEHVADNFGEVLPHLLFGDLTRYVLAQFLDVESGVGSQLVEAKGEIQGLLNDLEVAYAAGGEEVQELISVSFLENLPRPGEQASTVRSWLGPELSAQLQVIG